MIFQIPELKSVQHLCVWSELSSKSDKSLPRYPHSCSVPLQTQSTLWNSDCTNPEVSGLMASAAGFQGAGWSLSLYWQIWQVTLFSEIWRTLLLSLPVTKLLNCQTTGLNEDSTEQFRFGLK